MFRIRYVGRGGQGIKIASQVLGTAFFLQGFEVQDAPRYGAERRGAPIFAYVRAAREPINERGIITQPDLVIVADDSLVTVAAAGVLVGLRADTVLFMNSEQTASVWQGRLQLRSPILALPIGADPSAGGHWAASVGTACSGAAARLTGAIARPKLEAAVRAELSALGEAVVERNVAAALSAYDAMQAHDGLVREGKVFASADYRAPQWVEVAFERAEAAAPDIHAAATSVLTKTGLWRTQRPVIDHERCNRCAWICSTLCPDGAIEIGADHAPRIDYEHCKGCMVCVAVCPPHAIRAEREHERAGVQS